MPRLWEHVRGRCEYALQRRRRDPSEGERTWAGRAPKKMVNPPVPSCRHAGKQRRPLGALGVRGRGKGSPVLSARQFIGAVTTALSLITGAFVLALAAG